MDDIEFDNNENDAPVLPKGCLNTDIKELLPSDMRCATDAKELMVQCCTEFVHLLSSEANEMCNKQNKRTVGAEHILLALENLGFQDYVTDVSEVLKEFKDESTTKRNLKKQKKKERAQKSETELADAQRQLFEQARKRASMDVGSNIADDDVKKEDDEPSVQDKTNIETYHNPKTMVSSAAAIKSSTLNKEEDDYD